MDVDTVASGKNRSSKLNSIFELYCFRWNTAGSLRHLYIRLITLIASKTKRRKMATAVMMMMMTKLTASLGAVLPKTQCCRHMLHR